MSLDDKPLHNRIGNECNEWNKWVSEQTYEINAVSEWKERTQLIE